MQSVAMGEGAGGGGGHFGVGYLRMVRCMVWSMCLSGAVCYGGGVQMSIMNGYDVLVARVCGLRACDLIRAAI